MAAFPSYVSSLILLAPYIISLNLHLLDVFYLKDELVNRGGLAEPDAPKGKAHWIVLISCEASQNVLMLIIYFVITSQREIVDNIVYT